MTAAGVSGFAVMSLELLEARLMAPFFGSSILVWTNIIGVILAAMALGAWVGGLAADRCPRFTTVAKLLLAAGVWAVFLAGAGRVVLAFFVRLPQGWVVPVASLLLFAPPSFLLGAVPPAVIRLTVSEVGRSGHAAGLITAVGTLGGLLGTYATGYLLLPRLPVTGLLAGIGICLLAVGLMLHGRRPSGLVLLAVCVGVLVAAPAAYLGDHLMPGRETPSAYNYVAVREVDRNGEPAKVLMVNAAYHSAALSAEPQVSVFDYVKSFHVVDELVPQPRSMLLVGGGGMHAASEFVARSPEARADVLEIDPAVYRTALVAFGVSDPRRISVTLDDARPAMRRLDKTYDVIIVDAFGGDYCVPWQLLTREAMADYARLLAPSGVLAANIILPAAPIGEAGRLFESRLAGTLRTAFDWVEFISLNKGLDRRLLANTLVLAGRGEAPDASALARDLTAKYGVTRAAPILTIEPGEPWTDDAGPADYGSLAMYAEAQAYGKTTKGF